MATSYLPSREADFLAWTIAFLGQLAADPAGFGLTVQTVDDYRTTQGRFAAAFAVVQDRVTRSPANLELKDEAKRTLVNATRMLVNVLQAWPQMTDGKRRALGITVRDPRPTPVPQPTARPGVAVVSASRRTVKVRVFNDLGTRGRAAGAMGASIFAHVGPAVPAASEQWRFMMQTTRGTADVTFGDEVPSGSTVWITACWYNRRAENGPAADAVSANLPGGQAVAA